jgi:uncharacterized beta-barrel protein YwiB (DUF1934 family)
VKEVVARVGGEDLERWREVENDFEIMRSGSVSMSMEQAREFARRRYGQWEWAMQEFDLEDDEFYVFDPVAGTVSISKDD